MSVGKAEKPRWRRTGDGGFNVMVGLVGAVVWVLGMVLAIWGKG